MAAVAQENMTATSAPDKKKELRIGVDIGFKKISVSVYEDGVPRILATFPSITAYTTDQTEWHFGTTARSYLNEENYIYIVSVKKMLLAYVSGQKDAIFPLLLERLFKHVKLIAETEQGDSLQSVAVVLPHGFYHYPEIRYLIFTAWQKNGVSDLICISDTSAILLTYIAQTLDRQALIKNTAEHYNLIVCIANYQHFQVDVFEIIHNNYVVKYQSNTCVVWHSLGNMRRRMLDMVYKQLQSVGMRPLDSRSLAEFEEELMTKVALFNESRTDKIMVRAPFQNVSVAVTRDAYDTITVPAIDEIRKHIVSELTRFGIMDPGTQKIFGKVEVLLVGENSRLSQLRDALTSLLNTQLNEGVVSYVDDAEAFGAATAIYLAGVSQHIDKQHLLFRLQEGLVLNMGKILNTFLPLDETRAVVQPARDVFVTDLPAIRIPGQLVMGNPKDLVEISDFYIVLSTQATSTLKLHYVELEGNIQGQTVTFMRALLGTDILIKLRKTSGQSSKEYLHLYAIIKHPDTPGWNNLWVFAHDTTGYDRFMAEYDVRLREMMKAFPSLMDTREPSEVGPSFHTYVALVSDQLDSKHSYNAPTNKYHASMVAVNTKSPRGAAIIIKQCQEVTEKLQVVDNTFIVEPPYGIRKSSGESDTVIIEFASQVCMRIRFPTEASRKAFLNAKP
ncbi:uncharacterized protein LOC129584267 [Paramacrobiotus metropolitanus]|uniref:uncharacterized protein LOC129584267 n=1 Tax=Paramacrobiotus metropolitanus TaxID=2943436 RepID=UPI002445E4F5|nr:uncharacterized protein LOC129584267 [Paramacrobiotus metropolitanus]